MQLQEVIKVKGYCLYSVYMLGEFDWCVYVSISTAVM